MLLTYQFAGMEGIKPAAVMTVLANGRVAARWPSAQSAPAGPFIACIPAEALGPDKVLVLNFLYSRRSNYAKMADEAPLIMARGLRSLVAEPVAKCDMESSVK